MTWRFDGYNWLVRLDKGELLIESLTRLVKEQNVTGAWISGIGGAVWAELGFYDLDSKQYTWKKLDQPMEITGLQGNVAWDNPRSSGEPVLHIHGMLSNKQMQAFGGHIKELEVAATCEILLHRWYDQDLVRSQDVEVGLNLLDL